MTEENDLAKLKLSDQVNAVAENAYLKLGVRLFPFVIALVGWFLVHEIGSVEKAIESAKSADAEGRKALWEAQRSITDATAKLTTTIQVLSRTVEANRERSDVADSRMSSSLEAVNHRLELLVVPLPQPKPN